MADRISAQQRSINMGRIKGRDTGPELIVRRLVYSMGYRYRLHRRNLPGKPDLVFGPRRKVIFVHGCFWHQHPVCRAGRIPASNTKYWLPKLRRNVDRDIAIRSELEEMGWDVIVVWECETKNEVTLRNALRDYLLTNDCCVKAKA